MGAGKKKILVSCNEVSLHNTPKDCWVIVNAKVIIIITYIKRID